MTNPGVYLQTFEVDSTEFFQNIQIAVKLNDTDFNHHRSKKYLFMCCLKTKRLADIASKLSNLIF